LSSNESEQMQMRARLTIGRPLALLTVVVLGLIVGASSAAADTPVATVDQPTPIRSWKGIGAFSVYDRQAGVYRLAVTFAGGVPQLLPVSPRTVVFDADVGPDTDNEAAIVYSRCEHEPDAAGTGRQGCDIYRYSLTRKVESPISNANSTAASEFNPTIWRGRVAWVRTYDQRKDDTPSVYTRELNTARLHRSQRLPGVSTRSCVATAVAGETACRTTMQRRVDALELYGRWAALNTSYNDEPGETGDNVELRLDDLDGGSRQIARIHNPGLGGQRHVGPSFDRGRLYFARTCAGDPGGCSTSNSGAFRYGLSTGAYELAGFVRRLTGFSYVDAQHAYEVQAPETRQGSCGNSLPGEFAPCQIVLTGAMSFHRTKAPR
jgi:hypothetical protein